MIKEEKDTRYEGEGGHEARAGWRQQLRRREEGKQKAIEEGGAGGRWKMRKP